MAVIPKHRDSVELPDDRLTVMQGYESLMPASRWHVMSALQKENELVARKSEGRSSAKRKASRKEANTAASIVPVLRWDDVGGRKQRNMEPAKAVARWYLLGKTGLEELILQLYFGSMSLADVESVTSLLWRGGEGADIVREMVGGIVERMEAWLNRPVEGDYPYVYLSSVEVRRRRLSDDRSTRIATAVGVSRTGHLELLAVASQTSEEEGIWGLLLGDLAKRGLRSPRLFIGENDDELRKAVACHYRSSPLMGSVLEFERDLLLSVKPSYSHIASEKFSKLRESGTMAEARRAMEDLTALFANPACFEPGCELRGKLGQLVTYLQFPRDHWRHIQDVSAMRSVLNRVREHLRLLGPVMDDKVLVLLTSASFRHQWRTHWGRKPYLCFED